MLAGMKAPPWGTADRQEDAMTDVTYAADISAKTSLRPARQAIKRAALGLSLALGVTAAAYFGYDYFTTGRYLESTDDAYVKADSTIVSPKVSATTSR
jgi:membrane fusion protein (multidrug efflux system)